MYVFFFKFQFAVWGGAAKWQPLLGVPLAIEHMVVWLVSLLFVSNAFTCGEGFHNLWNEWVMKVNVGDHFKDRK